MHVGSLFDVHDATLSLLSFDCVGALVGKLRHYQFVIIQRVAPGSGTRKDSDKLPQRLGLTMDVVHHVMRTRGVCPPFCRYSWHHR
jgi:hypothetical protein